MHLPRTNTEKHGIRQKQKHGKEEEEKTFLKRNFTETKHCIRFELMNDFKAHGLRSMGLLELATDEHGKAISRIRCISHGMTRKKTE